MCKGRGEENCSRYFDKRLFIMDKANSTLLRRELRDMEQIGYP